MLTDAAFGPDGRFHSKEVFALLSPTVAALYNRDIEATAGEYKRRHKSVVDEYELLLASLETGTTAYKKIAKDGARAADEVKATYERTLDGLRSALETSQRNAKDDPLKAMVRRADGTYHADPLLLVLANAERIELADRISYEFQQGRSKRLAVECRADTTVVHDRRHEVLVGALALEAARFGEPVKVSGSDEFMRRIEEIGRAMKIDVVRGDRAQNVNQAAAEQRQEPNEESQDEDAAIRPPESVTQNATSTDAKPSRRIAKDGSHFHHELQGILDAAGCANAIYQDPETFTPNASTVAYKVIGSGLVLREGQGSVGVSGLVLRANPSLPIAMVVDIEACAGTREDFCEMVDRAKVGGFVRLSNVDGVLVPRWLEGEEREAAEAPWIQAQQNAVERERANGNDGAEDDEGQSRRR